MLDINEFVKRAVKYLIEGLVVAICSIVLLKKKIDFEEILILALCAAATFSILDIYLPAAASSARNGVGTGLGINLMGGLRLM